MTIIKVDKEIITVESTVCIQLTLTLEEAITIRTICGMIGGYSNSARDYTNSISAKLSKDGIVHRLVESDQMFTNTSLSAKIDGANAIKKAAANLRANHV